MVEEWQKDQERWEIYLERTMIQIVLTQTEPLLKEDQLQLIQMLPKTRQLQKSEVNQLNQKKEGML